MALKSKLNIPESTFPFEELVKLPAPGTSMPSSLSFSPDGRWVGYLFSGEGSLAQQLFLLEIETGRLVTINDPSEGGVREENLSIEEILLRERQRLRALGITSYTWAKHENQILIPLNGDLYILDKPDAKLRKLFDCKKKPAQDARFSPDGKWVAFVQEAELFIVPVKGGTPRQLTSGAREVGKTHGLAEYIAQEEMARSQGYWWSADSRWIAYSEVDEMHIPVYRIMHQGKDFTGEGAYEDHRYPFAGTPNAHVSLGVISLEGGEPLWVNKFGEDDLYMARVDWLPEGNLVVQIENREQTALEIILVDAKTGKRKKLFDETNETWINLHNMFTPIKLLDGDEKGGFIWASERTGFRHFYLYNREGKLVRQLTQGEWMVDDIISVDEEGQRIYFNAWMDDPRQKHLYRVSFKGNDVQEITHDHGTHIAVIDPKHQYYIDTYHSIEKPPEVSLRKLADGSEKLKLFVNRDERLSKLPLPIPEMVSIHNRTGEKLYGAIYHPPQKFGKGPYPLIVYVYGGPHAQVVTDGWGTRVNMRAQYLAGLGFVVFVLDNRGSWRRGIHFEGAIKHHMITVEVEDQVDGVHYMVERGLADPKRVGIYGWSYGGYMSIACMEKAAETFHAAAAGAPVSAWDGYDTFYTEHYMGTPQANPDGYKDSSLLTYVDKIQGKLLLLHGLIDENVHFRNMARLINALIAADKRHELLLLPDSRHLPRKPEYLSYMEERIRDFFLENL